MKFGVNYTPKDGWFHSWLDFDIAKVRDDFAAIASIGADHVRIFPLWPILQPNRTLIRPRAIDDVVATVEAADEMGLNASVDVLQGHLSSFDFLPSWLTTWHRRNKFTDQQVVEAEGALVRELASALRDHKNATGLTIGNEFIQFAATRHPDPDFITPDQAAAWLDYLLEQARDYWPEGVHVHCHDDDLWFDDTQPFLPQHAVTRGDMTTVHSWVFGRIGPRFGKDSVQLPWFARYICELAAAWGPNKPIWLQEIGAPENYVAVSHAPDFLMDTIDILMGDSGGGVTPGLQAITWWCSHDVSRELTDFPPLEHTLGLIDQEGKPKPIGEAFKSAVSKWGATEYHPVTRDALSLPDGKWKRSTTDATGELFDQWISAALNGEVHAIDLDTKNFLANQERSVPVTKVKTSFLSTRD